MKQFVDLHVHTTASDGIESPTHVVSKAHEIGLAGIAITDHDTTQGVDEGVRVGTNLGIEVVPGVEISCKLLDHRIHLLGFYIDSMDAGLSSLLEWMQAGREARLPKMLAKLRDLGIVIDQREVEAEAAGESTGRPHLARVLVRNGFVSSLEEAFDKYLAFGRPAYAERPRPTIAEGIQAILDAKGLPVIAHPLTVNLPLRELISPLIKQGLQGIEYYYPWQDVTGQPPEWYATIDSGLALLDEIAKEFKLILTGGTDYHGSVPDKADLGSIPVPVTRLESLRQRYKALFGKLPLASKPA
ncbi:MAG: PHP domain-containing protein [Promethearchaeota archaeon]